MALAKYTEELNEIMWERLENLIEARKSIISFDTDEPKYTDKILVCKDCGEKFIFSAVKQASYAEKGYQQPKRCKCCRLAKKIHRMLAV